VILPFPEQSCYIGFVTAVGATPAKTAAALSEAARAIEFELAPLECEWWSRDIRGFTAPAQSKHFRIQTIECPSNQEAREGIVSVLADAEFGYLPTEMALARARDCIDRIDGANMARIGPSFWFLAGDRDGVACGSASGSTGSILCLAVVPAERGSGLEAALAHACMERLAKEAAATVEVELDLHQTATTTLYGQLGFSPKTQDCGCCSC
jgi:hypothetical protein